MPLLAPRQMAKLSWMNHAEEFLSADRNGAPNTETEWRSPPGDASAGMRHPQGTSLMGSPALGLFASKEHHHSDKSSGPGHRVRPWSRHRASGSSLPGGRWGAGRGQGSIGQSSSCASAASRSIFNTLKHIPPIFYLWQMNV